MNDLKQEFTRAARHEPPLHTSRQDILSAGRSRQRRHAVLSTVSGAGVAALAVTAVLTLSPRAAPQLTVTPGASGSLDSSTPVQSTPVQSTPVQSTLVLPTPPVASVNVPETPASSSAHIAEVTANHKAKFSTIVNSIKAHLEGKGYTVDSMGSDDAALLGSRTGLYDIKMDVSKDGHSGVLILDAQGVGQASKARAGCGQDLSACSVQPLRGLGSVYYVFTETKGIGFAGRHVISWWSGVQTEAEYANDASGNRDLTIPDGLLLSLATDPSLDLSDVMMFTPEEVASFNLPSPGTKPADPSPTTGTESPN